MRLAYLAPILTLLACGPSKGDTADDTGTASNATTGTPPTGTDPTDPTTGQGASSDTAPCLDMADCPPCVEGCEISECVDGAWVCGCVECPLTGTDSATDTAATTTPTCGDPPACEPCDGCAFQECIDGVWECGCEPCDTTGGTTTLTSTSETATDSDTATDSGTVVVDCTAEPQVFPPLHNPMCMVKADCALVFHQVDCCGTVEAWGIGADAVEAFKEAEAVCTSQFPLCDCAPMPTKADDGQTAENPDQFDFECVFGICQSFVP